MFNRTSYFGRASRSADFTLIELMVVIVILGVLAGLVLPRIIDQPDKARVVKARMQMEGISMGLKQYTMDNGFHPTTEQGLRALVEKPNLGRTPKNYPPKGYMDNLPKDPWGAPYVYTCPGEHGDFDLMSYGPEGQEGGDGSKTAIKSWEQDS